MLRTFPTRRRNSYGPTICAITAALLLLLSVSLLHSRLTHHQWPSSAVDSTTTLDDPFAEEDTSLFRDSDLDLRSSFSDDRIDELDLGDDDSRVSGEDEILRGLVSEGQDITSSLQKGSGSGSGTGRGAFFFDHVSGVIRRALDHKSFDEVERWGSFDSGFDLGFDFSDDPSKVAFGSDDVPVDEDVRRKIVQVRGIEDALLLKLGSSDSPLREGWGPWFDAKTVFLRKDRMFKSHLEILNPLNNPLLQDPDGFGVTGLTKGDKLVQKGLLSEMKKVPFPGKKPIGNGDVSSEVAGHVNLTTLTSLRAVVEDKHVPFVDQQTERKRNDRRTLDDGDDGSKTVKLGSKNDALHDSDTKGENDGLVEGKGSSREYSLSKQGEAGSEKVSQTIELSKSESSLPMYAGGGRWGYFPGLHPHLSFSNFMDSFFRQQKCSFRVFMVWNSPPWMYTIRHQRGLESVLFHHRDACIVVFSETIELDFLKEFQKDGFKVAVAMPNLEELLKDTPTEIFASVWHEWRTTKFYSTHYSELIRLAALYKYGGIYLDCDIVVLKPLSSFTNTVGAEEPSPKSPLNGALMAFRKQSSFIKDCLLEYYSTYDDTLLRWNGADLLSRVAGNFSLKASAVGGQQEFKVQPSHIFFPVSSHDIKRYFDAPVTEDEKAYQDSRFHKILNESFTFHFWNSLTSTLIPEPESLVARILNRQCIRCSDVL